MRNQNVFLLATRTFVLETLGDFVSFPAWWYTKGLAHVAKARLVNISQTADNLAIRLLLLNIFQPMFAQYDRAGRIISFFMRIVILIAKGIYLFIYAIFQFLLLIIWVLVPIVIVYRLGSIFVIYVGS